MLSIYSCDGEDLHYSPLTDRKHRLRGVVPHESERLLYCDYIEERREHLFQLVLKRDLEGIVAKRKFDPYLLDTAKWYKFRNRSYSQWIGRQKPFERERASNPDWHHWNACALLADQAAEPV